MTVEMKNLGQLERYTRDGQRVTFEFGSARLAVTVLDEKTVRVRYAFTGDFSPRRSWAVAKDDSEYGGAAFEINETPQWVELATAQLKIQVRREAGGVALLTADGRLLTEDVPGQGPRGSEKGRVQTVKVMPSDEHYYGFGERTGLLNKRYKRYTSWTTDPVKEGYFHSPGADQMYQAIPFFMGLRPRFGGYGFFFNNTFKSTFDVGSSLPGYLSIEAAGGELDYYLFYGPEPAAIVEAYTNLTGRMPLPPRWALGYHQSRWSYYPEAKVREIADGFRARQIPAEVIHLDIDYMNGWRVFTWDKKRFPDPAKLCADLTAQGFKVVTIIDPGVKYDPGSYGVYDEGVERDYFIRKSDGKLFRAFVWPGDSVFADYARDEVRQWWGDQHNALLDVGVRGIWNDMNEPAMQDKPFGQDGSHIDMPDDTPQGSAEERTTHAELHNLFALLMDKATYEGLVRQQPERRPFVLTRAGYAGIQRWSAVWTGDNASAWEHLETALPQLCNMGLSGVSFVGTDIGGFWDSPSPELWARWVQLGAFYPFARGHACDGTPPKEPWAFGETTEGIARQFLELRYRLLPHLYTLFEESARIGAPIMRPLLYEFWQDEAILEIQDEVMVGNALLLAPVYRPGVTQRHVYLPQGVWYDFWNNKLVEGSHILADAPLAKMPLYVRGGTVLPLGPVMQYSDERPLDELTLHIYPDEQGHATGQLYEDDGESFAYQQGQSCHTAYTVTTNANGEVTVQAKREGAYQPASRQYQIHLHLGDGKAVNTELAEDTGDWTLKIARPNLSGDLS